MEGHFLSADAVVRKLGSDKSNGLKDSEAKRRLEKDGENKLSEKKKASLLKRFIEQFKDFCVIRIAHKQIKSRSATHRAEIDNIIFYL